MVTASGTSRFAYLDGVAGTENTTNKIPSDITNAAIGARVDTTAQRFFNGHIGEAGWWSVALTTVEMLALASGICPLKIRPNSLVAYHPLDVLTNARFDRISTGFDLPDGNAPDAGTTHPPKLRPFAQILQFPAVAAVGGTTPKGPLGMPLHGALGGPIG